MTVEQSGATGAVFRQSRPERDRNHARRHLRRAEHPCGGDEKWSRPISRVLSWTTIHLGPASPPASSSLPGCSAGHTIAPLFGLAPGGVYPAAACCHPRGALLPHLFTLTCALRPSAVCFLWHFPWARAPQALPGTLPCGARTFLPPVTRCAVVWPTRAIVWGLPTHKSSMA